MKEQYVFSAPWGNVAVKVICSRRRSVALEVKRTGEVVVRVPRQMRVGEMKRFVESHLDWIRKKRIEIETASASAPVYDIPVWETLSRRERDRIRGIFLDRIEYYASIMEVTYGNVRIRNQKTRWGSCSSKGNLNFNYRLAYLPKEFLDYVVVHELAHRRYLNHSKLFWQEVAQYCPEYRMCRKGLRHVGLG